jgi:hypothetical protein
MDLETLKSQSSRLEALEHNFRINISEVQSLRRDVDLALLAMQKIQCTDTPDLIHQKRSDSPLIFQPLTPAPRAPRRAQSSVELSKVWSEQDILMY